ncbi:MAG: pyridoxal-phosphate dependent enzyme [Rhodobiaceae bacterium]|nr:pyridoxal-phosphate dependent enzyme [Rhodobiaceae bacterium]
MTEFPDVAAAHERVVPFLHRTPVMTSASLDAASGAQLFFKCENFQKGGAFKARGAVNAVFSLDDATAARGVATHSSGNHGLSLCYAAARRGIPAWVVMPENAPKAKAAAVKGYGGEIVTCAPSTSAREATLADVIVRTGAEMVHPYDDDRVIAGQGTCAKELIEDMPDLDALIAPIGGGGLISGTILARDGLAPGADVYGGEPQQADDAWRSLKSGALAPADDSPKTIADGLKAPLKDRTWGIIRAGVADILPVSEDDIVAAMMLVWQRMKIIIEPSSAVAVAAVLVNRPMFEGKRVGVILTGGNVDLDGLPWMT